MISGIQNTQLCPCEA